MNARAEARTERGEDDVKVTYVGNKRWTVEGYSGKSISWEGKGVTQLVPPEVAEKLLQYPDQWMLQSDAPEGELPDDEARAEAARKVHEKRAKEQEKQVEDMTKEELVMFAHKHLDIRLDPGLSKAEMLRRIEDSITNERLDDEHKRNDETIKNEHRKGK